MSYEVLNQEGLEREIKFTVSAEEFNKEYTRHLKRLASNPSFKIQGFRPGHVPLNVAESYLGKEATQNALQAVNQRCVTEYATESKENVLNVFSSEAEWNEDRSQLLLTIKSEVGPVVELKDLSAVEVDFPLISEDKAIEEMILALRTQRSTYEDKVKEAELDDLVTYTAVAKDENGVDFPPLSGDQELVLGSYLYPSEFSASFIGRKAGEEFETTLDLRDQKYQMIIKLKSVKERKLGEVDEKFLADFLSKDNATLEDLKEEIKKNLKREIKANSLKYFLGQVNAKLLELYADLDVPKHLIRHQVVRNFTNFLRYEVYGNRKVNDQELKERLDELLKDEVVYDNEIERESNSFRTQYVTNEYIREHKIEITEADLDSYIEEVSIMFEQPEQYRREAYKNQEFIAQARNEIFVLKLAEMFKGLVKVVEKPMSYTDLVRTNNA